MTKASFLINCSVAVILTVGSALSQSGGQFQIDKSVIGSGGQTASGQFVLDGTIGQHVTDKSTGGAFELGSGFWGIGAAPAAQLVVVNGRVLASDGVRGLRNATVSITDSLGNRRTATTSSFGFFSFDNVLTGDTYTFRVSSRLFRYSPVTTQVTGDLTLADFVGLE